MTEQWKNNIPHTDSEIYELSGFGGSINPGTSPALLIIDVQYRTTGNSNKPIKQSIAEDYPTSCGDRAWNVLPNIKKVLSEVRKHNIPVFFPHVAPKTKNDGGKFGQLNPGVTKINQKGYEFVKEIEPNEEDFLLPKRHASAFFGTALASYLIDLKVDTVILVGCTTSGCIRATAVDAFSFNFATIIPEDCVYDRTQISHDVSLFDLNSKYADVLTNKEVLDYLNSIN